MPPFSRRKPRSERTERILNFLGFNAMALAALVGAIVLGYIFITMGH